MHKCSKQILSWLKKIKDRGTFYLYNLLLKIALYVFQKAIISDLIMKELKFKSSANMGQSSSSGIKYQARTSQTARQAAQDIPSGHHRPRIPLQNGQRGKSIPQPFLIFLVDEAGHRHAEALPCVQPREPGIPIDQQSEGVGISPPVRGRAHSGRGQPFPFLPGRGG